MTGFVVGGLFLLVLRQHHRPALGTHHDLVFRGLEIHHRDKATAHACGGQRGLVHEVRQIRTRETGRTARDNAQVYVRAKRRLARMHPKDFLAALDIGVAHGDLTVKAARTQQGRVQHVFAVGRGDDDHAFVRLKAVHLDQQLVQGLFTLVIATTVARATGPAHGVDLIDEHDAGRIFLGLFEHVAHTTGTHTNEHLDEVGTRDGKERHTRFAGNRPRQQGLTGTGRALKQRAFGDLAAQTAELLRVAQEFDDLFQLFLRLVDARHVVKRHTTVFFGQHLGLGLAEPHRPAFATALHAVHEIDPHTDQQKDGQQRHQEGLETGLLLGFSAHRDVLGHQQAGDLGVFGPDRDIVTAIGTTETNLFTIKRDVAHVPCFDSGHKFGIADFTALQPASRAAEQIEQRQNQKHQYNPKGEIAHITQRKVSYIRGTAPNTAPNACKIDTIGACSMRHMCGEKGIFAAFEHCLPVLRPTDKGGSDQFRALPHRRRGQQDAARHAQIAPISKAAQPLSAQGTDHGLRVGRGRIAARFQTPAAVPERIHGRINRPHCLQLSVTPQFIALQPQLAPLHGRGTGIIKRRQHLCHGAAAWSIGGPVDPGDRVGQQTAACLCREITQRLPIHRHGTALNVGMGARGGKHLRVKRGTGVGKVARDIGKCGRINAQIGQHRQRLADAHPRKAVILVAGVIDPSHPATRQMRA